MENSPCAFANLYLLGTMVSPIRACDHWLCVWIQEEEALDLVTLTAAALRALQLDRCRASLRCCLSLSSPFFLTCLRLAPCLPVTIVPAQSPCAYMRGLDGALALT